MYLQPNRLTRHQHAFTIVEMLGVLVILAILFTITGSVISTVQRKAQENRAAADANALVQAVLHYRQVYGDWPGMPTDDPSGVCVAGNAELASTLNQKISIANQAGAPIALTPNTDFSALLAKLTPTNNPRQILFLTVPTSRLVNGLSDPWGNPYLLIMGFPNTGPIPLTDKICFSNLPAFAISAGAPVANPSPTNWIFSAGVRP